MSIRLLSYNIQFGGANREKSLAAVIASCNADVVILQEATLPDVVERLAAACKMKRWGAIRGHSLAFMSRSDIVHHAWHRVRWARRRYLEIVLAGSHARVFGVHLSAIHSNLTELRRTYELRSLLRDIQRHQRGFHLLAGDFNTIAPGEHLEISKLPPRLRAIVWMTGGKIRWTTIQLMLNAGYTDAYRIFHKDDLGFTFPTWEPHVRLDYSFVPTAFASRIIRCDAIRGSTRRP